MANPNGYSILHGTQTSTLSGSALRSKHFSIQQDHADDRDLIGDFLKGTHGNKKCWTGLFSGPAQNWVGTGNEWKGRDWHCFAAMIVPNTVRGKNLRIYNNDAKQDVIPSSRISSVLWGLERTLWTEVQKRGNYVIWYSTDRPHAGTGKCFPHCFPFRSF
ncbi:hypothetical protein CSUB01_08896 [Colletotrichum sublineola]|uniref:Uncharacterized protein n=1 Tax=Colletotrichum sublineola TaxID=1173701 RepID=A0A066WYT7_COLSU|nr:hypothetical protein CSUB01_08896 [Colletotrichum sublineola]